MSLEKKNITQNSIGKIADHYGIDLRTLKKWIISRDKELMNKIENHLRTGGYVLPPDLVDMIYNTFGYPK